MCRVRIQDWNGYENSWLNVVDYILSYLSNHEPLKNMIRVYLSGVRYTYNSIFSA